jgi:tetratricopeptide (TPR) repeat protein
LGVVYIADCQYEQAIAVFETGLKQDCIGKTSRMMKTMLINLGLCYLSQGKLIQALSYCNQALEINQKLFDLPGETEIRFWIAQIQKCAGQLEQARQIFDGVLATLEKLGLENWQTLTMSTLAHLKLWSGEADSAYQLATKAEAIARRLAFPNLPVILILKGQALLALGQFDQAEIFLNETNTLLNGSHRRNHDLPYLVAAQIDLALAQGYQEHAGALAISFLPLSKMLSYDGNDDPFTVYASLFKALDAIGDPRATEILNVAWQELTRLTTNIPALFDKEDLLNIPGRARIIDAIHVTSGEPRN